MLLCTFAVDTSVTPGEPPVEVKSADGLDVNGGRPVEKHPLLDVHAVLNPLQLRSLPGEMN